MPHGNHQPGERHVTMTAPAEEPRKASSAAPTKAPTLMPGQTLCVKCHVHVAEYETDPCHHICFCKTCAMKCASGGRCKTCNQMYGGLRRKSG